MTLGREGLILQALVTQRQLEADTARLYAQRAAMLAKPKGFVGLFVNKGTPVARVRKFFLGGV